MISDRELDALLADAAGVRDADLPALPEDLRTLLAVDGPADSGLALVVDDPVAADERASVVAARQLVADAREARTAGRRRRPGRRTVVRITTALVAVAAAWATAVVVAGPDAGAPQPPDRSTDAPVTPGGIALVAGEAVTFPLSLDPVPEGLAPLYSRRGGIARFGSTPPYFVADFVSTAYADPYAGPVEPPAEDPGRILLGVYPENPQTSAEYGFWHEGDPTGTATVGGAEASVWRERGLVTLLWERRDGQWVQLSGEGPRASIEALVAVGESIVDRPQPVGLQFGLAPAGWSVGGYEESRSLDLVSDVDPDLLLRVSLLGPQFTGPLDDLLTGYPMAGPVESVTVQGQPARLALRALEGGDDWFLVGQLPGGRFFMFLAPPELTREQVLRIAEQITYTP